MTQHNKLDFQSSEGRAQSRSCATHPQRTANSVPLSVMDDWLDRSFTQSSHTARILQISSFCLRIKPERCLRIPNVCPSLWLSPKHKMGKYSGISGMPSAALAGTQAPEPCVCSQSDACEHKYVNSGLERCKD